ncbi:MAG: DMT family transporter [Ruminococcaceae bacterium]|nr:DMT family transporter [Oscillospiraceae bacterium]
MKKVFSGGGMTLLLTALIWGVAFVAQSEGVEHVGPFTFNSIRFLLGGLILLPCIVIIDKINNTGRSLFSFTQNEIKGGIACGIVLCVASSLQQLGIMSTSVGKAAFITSLYVVLVPLFGLFMKKKVGLRIWLCVVLALLGVTILSADFSGGTAISLGDLLCFFGAIVFALHIIVIDEFSPKADGVRMSCIQFFVAGILASPVMIFSEKPNVSQLLDAWLPICYAGLLSCGVAYTLQIIGQKKCPPATASIILSLESVFGAISGAIILGIFGGKDSELMNLREIFGCAIVFFAVVFAQLSPNNKE